MRSRAVAIGAALALIFCYSAEARVPRGSAAAPVIGGLFIPAVNDLSATNWPSAGLAKIGGYPTRSTVCATLSPSDIIPPTGADDFNVIKTAVAACPAGQVLVLGSGTSTSAVVTVAATSNTLTLNSGTLHLGYAIRGAGFYPGTTVTAGSGTTWTISIPPILGATVSSETVTVVEQYNFDVSEYIQINKSITVRGSGTCNGFDSGCPSLVNVYNGSVPSWATPNNGTPPGATGNFCGVTTLVAAACPGEFQSIVIMVPGTGGGLINLGWGGCSTTGQNPTTSNCGTVVAANISQGTSTVQVASTTNFSVGMQVLIDENIPTSAVSDPTGYGCCGTGGTIQVSADLFNSSASPPTMRLAALDTGEIGNYAMLPSRLSEEIHQIASIGAGPCPGTSCTLTFDTPVSLDFHTAGDARVYWPTISGSAGGFIQQAGLENISLTRGTGNLGGIGIEFCAYCWVKGVDYGGSANGAVNTVTAFRTQIEFNYFHLGYCAINSGCEYPIGLTNTSEAVVQNNIDVYGGKGMVGRAASNNVVAYNYVDKTFYSTTSSGIGDWFQEFGANGSHFAGSHHWLLEGNWTFNCDNDNTHGNVIYHTFFRNWCTALRSDFVDPSINQTVSDASGTGFAPQGGSPFFFANGPGVVRAAGPMSFDYWMAYAANYLGTTGVTTTANGFIYQINAQSGPGQTNKGIFARGWTNGGSATGSDPHLIASASPAYIFQNGNYDAVNAAVVDNAAGYTQAFPNSLYLAAKPAFFTGVTCVYPWPWITPTSAPFAQLNSCGGSGNPAKARYDAGTAFVQP